MRHHDENMIASTYKSQLAPLLRGKLSALRRRVRAYVWVEGLAAVAIVLGVAFWTSLSLDWLVEPPAALRAVLLGLVAVVTLAVLYRRLLRRAFVRLADRNLALLLERRFHSFGDRLITVVEMAEQPERAAHFSAPMLQFTHDEAVATAGNVRLGEVFDRRPLLRSLAAAIALAVSIVALAALAGDVLNVWSRRSLLLSEELWPRRTRLSVDGFDERGHRKLARGTDLELSIRADAAPGRLVPDAVEVRTYGASRRREPASREGQATIGIDPDQRFSYVFKSVLSSLEFWVVGGDARLGPLSVDVVDSPAIRELAVVCRYPDYMRRPERRLAGTSLMPIPRGTSLRLEAVANKDLVSVQIDEPAEPSSPVTTTLPPSSDDPQAFALELPALDADRTLLITLFDADGIRSLEPLRLSLHALPDEPPQVAVQLRGIGTAVTPLARIPVAGEINDDYGVQQAEFEFKVDEGGPQRRPLGQPAGASSWPFAGALEIADLQLAPKQKLQVAIRAADGCTLDGQPNVGLSQRYVLDVVTPDQLRTMLEARELQLRRRFEIIVQELTDTRNLLAGFDVGQERSEGAAPAAGDGAHVSRPGRSLVAARGPDDAVGEKAAAPAGPSRDLGKLRIGVQRVRQNVDRSRHETLAVAVAFDDIREELVNNRVDTEELKSRLQQGIADPLRAIVDGPFPQLAQELAALEGRLADAGAAPAHQAAAVTHADAIVVQMQLVLNKMLQLETYNEVLDELRGIIAAQEDLSQKTKEKQKQKARDLLED